MSALSRRWQGRGWLVLALTPLMLVYVLLASLRRGLYRLGILKVSAEVLPVVVVGNITLGGTGKSPLVDHLAHLCHQRCWQPGIVSRGYGGVPQRLPLDVTTNTSPAIAGDEAVMHARLAGAPVAVCLRRARAVQHLARSGRVNIVIADDGLQHAAMARAAEILVIDAARGFGNGLQLPAGPLREPVSRLRSVDLIAMQGDASGGAVLQDLPGVNRDLARQAPPAGSFYLQARVLVNLATHLEIAIEEMPRGGVHAVAGLGHPQRFFTSLAALGFDVRPHPFTDHHAYVAADLHFDDELPVLVTSKDAVKIERLDLPLKRFYEVRTELIADAPLASALDRLLDRLSARLPESGHA